MNSNDIVVLTGGTGTVKLIKGFNQIVPEKLVVIANTGDDFNYYGIKVSPDTDSVLYALSRQLDETKMWGLKDETFVTQNQLKILDVNSQKIAEWFNLGDKDLAHCLYREFLIKQGKTFTESVEIIKNQLKIKPKIFPMSDTDVTTFFTTEDGKTYHFEEFFIRLHSNKPIKSINYVNADKAKVSENLLKIISEAKIIIIGPSNPITSIGPILSIKKIKNAIEESKAIKIVISPIIGREAYSGPAKIYMKAKGIEVSPIGVFNYYMDVANQYYFDLSDKIEFESSLTELGQKNNKEIFFANIIFDTKEKQVAFAEQLIKKYNIN